MIIDCHGHYTTEPKGLKSYREQQVAAVNEKKPLPVVVAVQSHRRRDP